MQNIVGKTVQKKQSNQEHWLSMSDLMAGLMMVFLLISVAFMRYVQVERDKIKEVAVTYQESQVALYQQLMLEFEKDLSRWDAQVDSHTLEFRFNAPEVLFDMGKIAIKPRFQEILDDFFPRYIHVIKAFKDTISEVRIEGHTSSVWNQQSSPEEAYFNNMELSQGRTRAVLQYVYSLPAVASERDWIKKQFAAVGFSSAHIVLDELGKEDAERSRRVSFKVLTNAETQIRKIIANE
ncbi:OmpA family protein [uncultured Paenalcaligenes sp.]|uniref:OmpA/MotB family protein n=1 Tax=uncultured Paenalcaligenes sp. TaxID=1588925 RepID=UPI002601763E|nr:OmpA family protein [uncultured Paenalcaligenes sp.]